MHPFFSRTRASMMSCPTTNCRCSSGLRSSSGIVCQGMYCSAAGPAACFVSARSARVWEAAGEVLVFVLEREEDLDLDLDFDFAMVVPTSLNYACSTLASLSGTHLALRLSRLR